MQETADESDARVVAVLGALVGRFRGADSDLRQSRSRKRRFRLRHLHPYDRHPGGRRGDSPGTGQWQAPTSVSGRTYMFLVLSGIATGASWLCYFRALKLGEASRVAPIDKLSVVLVAALRRLLPRRTIVRARLDGRRIDRRRARFSSLSPIKASHRGRADGHLVALDAERDASYRPRAQPRLRNRPGCHEHRPCRSRNARREDLRHGRECGR